jgi:RNA polymerase sigma factor (sigma-70 family)
MLEKGLPDMTPTFTIIASDEALAPKVNEAFRRMAWHFAGNKKPTQLQKFEELEFISRAKKGDRDAMRALVDAHFGFLAGIARRVATESGNLHIVQDLMADALEAFTRAVYRYEAYHEARLSSYVRYSVVGELRASALRHGASFAMGTSYGEKAAIYRHKKLKAHFKLETGRRYNGTKADAQILSKITGLPAGGLKRGLETKHINMIPTRNIEIHDMSDTAEDDYARTQTKEVLQKAIKATLHHLTSRDKMIFQLLTQENPTPLEVVAEVNGLTVERIRQIFRASAKIMRIKLEEAGIKGMHDLTLEN